MSTVALKRRASLITVARASRPLPYVSLEDVESGTGRLVDELVERDPDGPGMAAVEAGDVLFGKLRPYLMKWHLVREPMLASNELLAIRPGPDVDGRWLSFLAASQQFGDWAVATSEGTKMPRTSWERLSEFRFEFPQLSTQRAIADFLDAETARIDALIAKKRRMVELLEQRVRLQTSIVFEEAIRNGARETRLRYLCSEITVGIVVTPAKWYVETGIRAVRGQDVNVGKIDEANLVHLSDEGDAANTKSRLRAGDVVVVRTGQAGAAAVVPESLDGANCIDLLIIRPDPGRLDPGYLESYLNSGAARRRFERDSVGAIQGHFNVGFLKDLHVPVPQIEEQRRVRDTLERTRHTVEETGTALGHQIKLLQEHRQALITAAVTGHMEVQKAA